ncbi:MAG: prepilin-type N-terminal cleavage/methylation domain-containing protein [Vulcanimicrobiota bacterium]
MSNRRGFSLMEIVIALAVCCVALVAFLSIFAKNNDHALGSRNRSVAILLAESLMDDIEAHTYGTPQPRRWTQTEEAPVEVWVSGREQQMKFHKTVTFENGSFVGDGSGDKDLITITITWREGFGDDQTSGDDNKELQVRVPVWR